MLYFLMVFSFIYCIKCDNYYNPDCYLSQNDLILQHGYPFETYEITTEDNYILTLLRIPYGKTGNKENTDKEPVLLVHALLLSSIHWLINGDEKSLGFKLADEGYDVWLINMRGTTHSRKHRYLNPDAVNTKYWDYSFHEVGYYDLPANIDFVLNKTNRSQLTYIGLSEGTTTFFVMASTRPEYNKRIKLFIGLAPVAFMRDTPGLWIRIAKMNYVLLKQFTLNLNIKEIAFPQFVLNIFRSICRADSPFYEWCSLGYQFATQSDSSQINRTTLACITSSVGGTSIKTLFHYLQLMNSNEYFFGQYDYGVTTNLIRYGQPNPPKYNLQLISAPCLLYSSPNDVFVNSRDLKQLESKLPNILESRTVSYEKFSHTDFCYAVDINKYVYDHLVSFIHNFTKSKIKLKT